MHIIYDNIHQRVLFCTLTYYKNGVRLGVVATGLTGQLCWAAALYSRGVSLRLTAKLPPAGWREVDLAAV